MEQSRWKSPVFWAGVVSAILSLLVAMQVINLEQSQAIKIIVEALLSAFAVFAAANNPTNKSGF